MLQCKSLSLSLDIREAIIFVITTEPLGFVLTKQVNDFLLRVWQSKKYPNHAKGSDEEKLQGKARISLIGAPCMFFIWMPNLIVSDKEIGLWGFYSCIC